jgi:subtilisin-like proprotein convertase family protein
MTCQYLVFIFKRSDYPKSPFGLSEIRIGDVALELTSPSGTKSIVWHAANAFSSNGNLAGMQIQSNAFFGEDSKGEWKLKVINTGIHKKEATFKGWQLKVTGHQ